MPSASPGPRGRSPSSKGVLDEPLLLTRDSRDEIHCLSNVCTHRGALVCEHAGVQPALRCRYHGRRFGQDGRFLSMPEFEGAAGFPSPADDLARVPFGAWGKFLFASLAPAFPLAELLAEVDARIGWLPLADAVFDPSRARDYLVRANWALYCDNYLEGFHIPYVHAALAGALDYGEYTTELYPWASLQLGVAGEGQDAFELPPSSADHGRRIAAYYFWLFPNTMVNVYPWGISLNVVRPLAPDRTRGLLPPLRLGPLPPRPRRRHRARPRGARGRGGGRERAARHALADLPPRPLLPHPRAGGAPLPSPAHPVPRRRARLNPSPALPSLVLGPIAPRAERAKIPANLRRS